MTATTWGQTEKDRREARLADIERCRRLPKDDPQHLNVRQATKTERRRWEAERRSPEVYDR